MERLGRKGTLMPGSNGLTRTLLTLMAFLLLGGVAVAQRLAVSANNADDSEFGPVMRAYLGYLNNEQDVVDDRASRREITAAYYRRNSNRIRALRQTAVRLARQSGNDYVLELEAVTLGEFGTLFETPPKIGSFRVNEILANRFRFLGAVRSGEVFYVFARLDPYEQAEVMRGAGTNSGALSRGPGQTGRDGPSVGEAGTRRRRAVPK